MKNDDRWKAVAGEKNREASFDYWKKKVEITATQNIYWENLTLQTPMILSRCMLQIQHGKQHVRAIEKLL